MKSGGDYLHARLLMPSLFALLAPLAVVPWSRKLLAPFLVVGVWALVAIAFLRPVIHQGFVPLTGYGVAEGRDLMTELTKPGHRPIRADDFVFVDGPLAKRLQEQGEKALVIPSIQDAPILDATPQRTTLVSRASGISGYLAGPEVLVHESNSLADPVGSHMPPNHVNTAGHRKREAWPWRIALTAEPGVTAGFSPHRIAAARHALGCGALARPGGVDRGPDGPRHLLVEPHRRRGPHPSRRAPGRGRGGTNVLRPRRYDQSLTV